MKMSMLTVALLLAAVLPRAGLAACFVALLAGVALLGFNESAHCAWIVDNVMPRFVWLCALPLLSSAKVTRRPGENRF